MPVLVNPSRFATAGTTYAAEVLADSPLVYWRLGDSSGTTVADSSGNARNGTYTASPTLGVTGLVTGDADTAVTLNGTSQFGSLAFASWMDGHSFVTVEAIVKPSNVTGVHMVVIHYGSGGPWQFYINNGTLNVTWADTGHTARTATSAASLATSTKYHVAFVIDNTGGQIYINGSADGFTAHTGGVDTAPPGAGLAFGVSNAGNSQFFAGTIDEVAFYGTALSSGRIAAHAALV